MSLPPNEVKVVPDVETVLQKLIAITEKTDEVPRSSLDRYFWIFVLVGLVGVPIMTIALAWGIAIVRGDRPAISGIPVFELSEVRVTGSNELCPGETLDFEFDVIAREVGTYNLWMSTWRSDPPPATIIFSETEPFVIGSVREFPIKRMWIVPFIYEDKADNTYKPFAPGSYIRDISVTAEGRDTRNDPIQVAFTIRDDCKKSGGIHARNVKESQGLGGDSGASPHLRQFLFEPIAGRSRHRNERGDGDCRRANGFDCVGRFAKGQSGSATHHYS